MIDYFKRLGFNFPWLLLLTGWVQGWSLWGLFRASEAYFWPKLLPELHNALGYAALVVPFVIYWTQTKNLSLAADSLNASSSSLSSAASTTPTFSNASNSQPSSARRLSWFIPTSYGLLFGALGAYLCWVSQASDTFFPERPADKLATLVLAFVSVNLLCGFERSTRRFNYARLFDCAWRNGILTVTAGAFTAALWMVLFAGAALMELIGITSVMKLLQKPIFAFPVTGLLFGFAFSLGLERANMIETIRRFWLSILAWLLLPVLLFSTLWVCLVPFQGLETLFKTRNAAFLMLWFTALAVKFANCVYQDGLSATPYPQRLRHLTQFAWLSLIPVVAIAWWALGLRVHQYGWTEDRLWAALAAFVAGIYVLGYASVKRQSNAWMPAIGRTNIAAALVLCGGLVAFLSPLANAQRLAVASQMHRLRASQGTIEPDWQYLRWQSGRYGLEALQSIADGMKISADSSWPLRAKQLLQTQNQQKQIPLVLNESEWRHKFVVYPVGKMLSSTFLTYAASTLNDGPVNACSRNTTRPCIAWMGDLNADGTDEVVVFHRLEQCCATLYEQSQNAWRPVGSLEPVGKFVALHPQDLNSAHLQPAQWQDLLLGVNRWRVSNTRETQHH